MNILYHSFCVKIEKKHAFLENKKSKQLFGCFISVKFEIEINPSKS